MSSPNLDPEGIDIYPEDFSSSTAREERLSAEYHRAADELEKRSQRAKVLTVVALADTITTSPAILDKPVLCSLGVIGSIIGTAGVLSYRSLTISKRDLANEGPQPEET